MTVKIAEGEKWTNANGRHDCTCGCGTWINHRTNYVTNPKTECKVVGCGKTEGIVGGHMYNSESKDLYIIPLCGDHNKQFGETLNIKECIAVRAVKGNSCKQ